MSDALQVVFPYLLLNQTFLFTFLPTPGSKYPLWKENSCTSLVFYLFQYMLEVEDLTRV